MDEIAVSNRRPLSFYRLWPPVLHLFALQLYAHTTDSSDVKWGCTGWAPRTRRSICDGLGLSRYSRTVFYKSALLILLHAARAHEAAQAVGCRAPSLLRTLKRFV